MIRHLIRALKRERDAVSPVVDDSDTAVWRDHMCMLALLDDIAHACSTTHEATVPHLSPIHTAVLELSLEELRDDTQWVIPLAVIA
jgi:hypothetical protein